MYDGDCEFILLVYKIVGITVLYKVGRHDETGFHPPLRTKKNKV